MTNNEKYDAVFVAALELPREALQTASQTGTPVWDSVAQLAIIGGLGETFGITIAPEDILALSSYEKGKAVLRKYGVTVR